MLDDLSTGARDAIGGVELVVGDVADTPLVTDVLGPARLAVVHFAAKKQVGESVADPLLYYRENVGGLEIAAHCNDRAQASTRSCSRRAPRPTGCRRIPAPIREDARLAPESPYGYTKVGASRCSPTSRRRTGLHYSSLRYFNVAGAATDDLGDRAVLNLIPIVFQAMAWGRRAARLRQRLPDAGRHLHPRLRPRGRPRRRASRRLRGLAKRTRRGQTFSRHGDRQLGARGAALHRDGDGPLSIR